MQHAASNILLETFLFVGGSLSALWVCRMLSLSVTLGYLLVGILIGPSGLQWLSLHHFHDVGHMGVLVLLFMVGLELPSHRLQSLRVYIFGLGTLQIALSTVVIGVFISMMRPFSLGHGLLAVALSFSSTAIVLQLLSEKGLLSTKPGRASFSVLLLQDIAFVLLLVLADVLYSAQNLTFYHGMFLLGKVFLHIIVLYYGGRGVASFFSRFLDQYKNTDIPLLLSLSFFVGMAYLGVLLGLSAEFGAFVAGLSWADTKYRHHIEHYVRPFRIISLAIFFVIIGIKINISAMIPILPLVGQWLGILFLFKACIMGGLGWVFGLTWVSSLKIGVLMAGCGELVIILLEHPFIAKTLGHERNFYLSLTIMSMVMTPFVFSGVDAILHYMFKRKVHVGSKEKIDIRNHVIIAGFGRTGMMLSRLMEKNMVPYITFDYDFQRVSQGQQKHSVIHGDARDQDFLKKIGLPYAKVLIITFDTVGHSVDLVNTLRLQYPDIDICVRIRNLEHAQKLESFGVSMALPDNIESGMKLASMAFTALGFSQEDVHAMLKISAG